MVRLAQALTYSVAAVAFGLAGLVRGAALRVEVANDDGAKSGNRRPAKVAIDSRKLLGRPDARIDPQSLALHRLDASGKPVDEQLPVRFDDRDPKPDSFHWATCYQLTFKPWTVERGYATRRLVDR